MKRLTLEEIDSTDWDAEIADCDKALREWWAERSPEQKKSAYRWLKENAEDVMALAPKVPYDR